MDTQIEMITEPVETHANNVSEWAHKAFLAGLGAVMLAQDEVSEFMHARREQAQQNWKQWREDYSQWTDKLVDRGAEIEKENRERWEKARQERQEQWEKWLKEAEERFNTRLEGVLSYAHLPTNADFEDLGKKINALGRKVDKMRKTQEEQIKTEALPASEAV